MHDDRAVFAELAQRLGINDYDERQRSIGCDLTKGAVDDLEAFPDAGVTRPERAHGDRLHDMPVFLDKAFVYLKRGRQVPDLINIKHAQISCTRSCSRACVARVF